MSDIVERLIKLQVASCNCGTKTPELKYHADDCHYRGHAEAETEITSLRKQLSDPSTRDAAVTQRALQMAGDWHFQKAKELKSKATELMEMVGQTLSLAGAELAGTLSADFSIKASQHLEYEAAILALSPNVEGYVMVPEDKVSRLRKFLQDWQVGRGGDYDQDVADFLAMTTGAKPC